MSKPLVNGETAHSKALDHFESWPVVHDSIDLYKSNPYGNKSIEFASELYVRFAKPLFPYFQTPYSYAKPYAEKADELADGGLTRVEKTFPIVKENTETIKDTALSIALYPLTIANEGRNYVVHTFNDELSKTSGNGILKFAKAAIGTEIKFGLDAYHVVYEYWTSAKETTKTKAEEINKKTQN